MSRPKLLDPPDPVEWQEDTDRLVQAGFDDGYTKVVIVGREYGGTDVINLRRPDDCSGDAEEDRLGVLCVRFYYDVEEPTSDYERIIRHDHQRAVLQQLRKQFGDHHEAVASNEGGASTEIVRDYRAYTLKECQDIVKYLLRVVYIPGITRSSGQKYYEKHLRYHRWRTGGLHNSYWVEDYDLYRTLREVWARYQNIPSTKYPAGWGKWLGEEYGRTMARDRPSVGSHGLQVRGHTTDGSEVKASQQLPGTVLPRLLWGTLVVNLSHDTEELHLEDPDFEDRSQHKRQVIQLLILQFGRDRDVLITNEGPEFPESVREYQACTLHECLDRVDYRVRVLYIHRIHKEEGEGFCKHCLAKYPPRFLHGLRKSAWVDSYDLLRILLREWARQHEPLYFLDTQGEMELSSVPTGGDPANIASTLAACSLQETASTVMTGDANSAMSDVDDNDTTNDEYYKTKWQRIG